MKHCSAFVTLQRLKTHVKECFFESEMIDGKKINRVAMSDVLRVLVKTKH